MNQTSFETRLGRLYSRIQACTVCEKMCNEKALRRTDAVDRHSDVFIVSQALAQGTLRKSGVNFFNERGELGGTGKRLEKLLNLIGRTVYPTNEVRLQSGAVIFRPEAVEKAGWASVYNTELTQCYPGKNDSGSGDRKPYVAEIMECKSQGFLLDEVELVRPKLVLTMGAASTRYFLRFYVSGDEPFASLTFSDYVWQSLEQREPEILALGSQEVYYIPILHASPANSHFKKFMDRSADFVRLANHALGHG